ncbi:hypothetical protein Tco_0551292 [Tanacetum coccineum]
MISGTPGGTHEILIRRLCPYLILPLYNTMVMEIDATPLSPKLMTSAKVATGEDGREIEERPQLTTPMNPTSNITSSSQTHFVTPIHPDTQAGVLTRINYSSEDVDRERELEAPPGFWSQPPKGM